MLQRKATFQLYPTPAEAARMEEVLGLHCRVYNTLKEEHQHRYEAKEPTFSFSAMCQALTGWRAAVPALADLNAQSLQVTAKRVALAFDAFFRRVRDGETPGYPRFKAFARYPGWGYKTHGDGWKLLQQHSVLKPGKGYGGTSYGAVRLSGIGTLRLRGRSRFAGVPKIAEVLRKGDKWFLSVTFNVEPAAVARAGGSAAMAFDWGLTTLLTQVVGDALTGSVETLDNPRWLRKQLETIQTLQQTIARLETRAQKASGKEVGFPVNGRLKEAYQRLRALHSKIARQRQDFYHQLSAALVKRFGVIATEELMVKNMSRAPKPKQNADGSYAPNGAAAKAGLNRSILDAAPAGMLNKLRYKAAEAGSKWYELPTRKLKPSQRCCGCGGLKKLKLDERVYACDTCGTQRGRDENAARTMLRHVFEGAWWDTKDGVGTVPAAAAPAA